MTLAAGQRVRLKTTTAAALGVERRLRGGEAVIVAALPDPLRGEVYQVQLSGSGRTRIVLRADLVVHRRK